MNEAHDPTAVCSHLAQEPGGWFARRSPQPDLAADARRFVTAPPARRPGNPRFGIADRTAYLLAEVRDDAGLLSLPDASALLVSEVDESADEICSLEVASLLGETGYPWSPVSGESRCWTALAADPRGLQCGLFSAIVPGGVEVRGRLASWETTLSSASQAAIAHLLASAHLYIRFARYALDDREAAAVSFATARRLDVELPDSVAAVVESCRLVWREVRALTEEGVAQAYLEVAC